jgi:hypothetical protein
MQDPMPISTAFQLLPEFVDDAVGNLALMPGPLSANVELQRLAQLLTPPTRGPSDVPAARSLADLLAAYPQLEPGQPPVSHNHVAATLNNLGLGYTHQGRWAEAEQAFQESLARYRQAGDRKGETDTLLYLWPSLLPFGQAPGSPAATLL